ncbi:alpha/beta hydrolase [Streptomyces sp. MK7]|uniref:alpha/beta hydrolase n=1 Tax=Streptomyces sp. MK7 TaxID=3067635 RepID=UPI0029313E54|nr:alpha/beta hydrolase [Streptomyces sp. MK7]
MRARIWISGRSARACRRRADGFGGRSRLDGVPAALRRHAAPALLILAVAVAAGAGCHAMGGPGPGPSASGQGGGATRRAEVKATDPPPGLPAVFTTGQRLDWASCPAPSEARGGGDAPGDGWECATMKAPLDYRRPDRDTIDVALIRKRATGPERKRIGSLLFNFGGPGESGVTGLPRFADDYTSLGERYDLVSFDPRGVGRTAPVSCGEKEFESGDACEKHSGRLLPYVGTSQTARDLDLMRYLLGDEKLNYFGVSYGTELGGVYAHLFPKNVGRLVLEAPVDPTLDLLQDNISQVKAVQLAFDRFTRHCAKTYDDCPTGNDPEQAGQRVIELLDKLEKKPAPTGGGEKLDADLAAHAIANFLDLGKQGRPPLVKALSEVMERGTGGKLLEKAYDHAPGARARAGVGDRGGVSGDNSVSAYVAITCADSNLRPGFTEAEEMIKKTEAASPVFGKAWSSFVYLCYDWPFKGERATPDVSADGAPPIVVVANTGDSTTPYEGAKHMVRELGEKVGVLLTVRAEGHGSYPYSRCATRTVDTYLLDGTPPERGTTCS